MTTVAGNARNLILRTGTDVPFSESLPRLLWETGTELFAYMFGGDHARFLHLMPAEWAAPAGLHCAADTHVACCGDDIVGLVNAFPSHEIDHRISLTFYRYRAALDDKAWTALENASAEIGWLFPPAPRDSLMVLNLAVDASARGRGIGRLLMQEAETKARHLGFASIHIDTAAGRPAVAFYQRIGFEAVVESRLLRPAPAKAVPPHIRMIKRLD